MKRYTQIITKSGWILAAALLFAPMFSPLFAQTNVQVTSPGDISQTTTLDANVSEQANVTVPAIVNFAVNDITVSTGSGSQSVTAADIVLATTTKYLVISVEANAANFTKPTGATITYVAGDVTWNASTWTGGATGAALGTLSSSAYHVVDTCDANVATCSTSNLVFTLASKPTITVAGTYSMGITWKFESMGS